MRFLAQSYGSYGVAKRRLFEAVFEIRYVMLCYMELRYFVVGNFFFKERIVRYSY